MQNKVDILSSLTFPSILSYQDVVYDLENRIVFLVMDFAENGQLMTYREATMSYTYKDANVPVPIEGTKNCNQDIAMALQH
ncbi:hypothetical protein DAPPUDRAFT_344351, partial [Daphnia pulex]